MIGGSCCGSGGIGTCSVGGYQGDITATIAAGRLERAAQWTESLAVGGEALVRQMSQQVESRQDLRLEGVRLPGGLPAWTPREESAAYA